MDGAVKGSAISSVVEDVQRLVAEGRLTPETVEAALDKEDLALLDPATKILPSLWYPLASYGRLTELLLRHEGNGELEYLVERGRRAAEWLRAAGLYAQLSANRARWGERVGEVMILLGPQIYRDTAWQIRFTDFRFVIEVDVPASFPDVCRYQTQGFIEHAASHARGDAVRVASERAFPTRVLFRGEPG